MTVRAEDLPNYERDELTQKRYELNLVHDLLSGTRRMWDQSHIYIRKWHDESQETYDLRRKMEILFEGLARTLNAATGMLFAVPPAITWQGEDTMIEDHWTNIDNSGTSGEIFMKRFASAALSDGLAALLVDHTPTPIDPATQQPIDVRADNEGVLGLRPTWAIYHRAQIINWRTAVVNGQRLLTLVVLKEEGEEESGLFGTRCVTRYRVLRMVDGYACWTLYKQVKAEASTPGAFVVDGSGYFRNKYGENLQEIPFAIAYTGDTRAPLTATIPLLGVAWANLAHWQIGTDMRFYRHLCAFPQPTVVGTIAQEPGVDASGNATQITGTVRVGPMVVIHLETGGEFKWTELTGTSITSLQNGANEKMDAMSKLGFSFLTRDTSAGVESAEAKRLDATAENSSLATSAQGIEDAVNKAFELHTWYLGLTPDQSPVCRVSRDYDSTALDARTMLVYVQAVAQAGLPVRLLLEAWMAGGRLPPDADLDAIEMEMMANAAALAQAKADEAAAKTAGLTAGGAQQPTADESIADGTA